MKGITCSGDFDRKTSSTRAVLVGMAIGLAGMAVPAFAADIPVATCGFVINAPGNYGVVADLNCPAGATAITINASNVSLKLNSHIITGTPGSTTTWPIGININPGLTPRLDHVGIVGPGVIQRFNNPGTGILINNTDYSLVSGVTVAFNGDGIEAVNNNFLTVRSSQIVANLDNGLDLGVPTNNTFAYNDLSGNHNYGLWMGGGSANIVNNNVASGNGADGITIAGNYSRVYSNVTNGNGGEGIDVYPTTFENTPTGGEPTGVAPVGNQFFNNTSSVGNGSDDLTDNTVCGLNFWSNNVFFTGNKPCIH
ncbi:MAG: right-handed parallel beta-helix repeat-containing protein [Bryobacteraceae bacterium]|jgi:parallel beta-helix repeat protein